MNGQYQSCEACHKYAHCHEGVLYTLHCDPGLEFDDNIKNCVTASQTCPVKKIQPSSKYSLWSLSLGLAVLWAVSNCWEVSKTALNLSEFWAVLNWYWVFHSSFSRYAFLTDLADLTDFQVNLYSLLLFVLIIWQCTHNLASIRNVK